MKNIILIFIALLIFNNLFSQKVKESDITWKGEVISIVPLNSDYYAKFDRVTSDINIQQLLTNGVSDGKFIAYDEKGDPLSIEEADQARYEVTVHLVS